MNSRKPSTAPMAKVYDYIHWYRGHAASIGRCRIRIYERLGDVPIVIVSELAESANTSVTNLAEYLAAEIIAKHFPQRFEEEIPVVWIEHYPASEAYLQFNESAEYSLVDFDSYTPRRERSV